ncbi:MAG: acyl-CoA thioesterase [Labilithrix sp.]|nr:acyl-CoA thioesterase [Labilithrix sp.]MBX3223741.1 acyl-CoA thioesterase [Labilithrix sp.]
MQAEPAISPTPFSTHSLVVDVADTDIDELGHASNIAYVRWIQQVAIAHSTAVGLDFEAYRKLGGVFFIRRHEIDYLRPVLRTDRVEVRTWIDSATAVKCKRATVMANQDGTVVARAMTTWGYVDTARGRPVRIPDVIRTAFMVKSDDSAT